jgi:hypothetical protein
MIRLAPFANLENVGHGGAFVPLFNVKATGLRPASEEPKGIEQTNAT